MRKTRLKLGEMLKQAGFVTDEQIEKALQMQKRRRKPIGDILVDMGFVTEKDIAETLAIQLEIPFISGEKDMLKPKDEQGFEKLIPPEIARQYTCLPLSKDNNLLTIAIADPLDVMAMDNLKSITNCEINPVIATKSAIKKAMDDFYGAENLLKEAVEETYKLEGFEEVGQKTETITMDEAMAKAETAPVIRFVDLMLMDAIKSHASDIHIEPFENKLNIRYRIDGALFETPPPSEQLIMPLISRIKIMAKMDISEKRLPQDGAFTLKMDHKVIDFRVSTMPTIFGEKVVIRLLDKSTIMLKLEDLGIHKEALIHYGEAISKPYGLILITGPTGSGKSTTLYTTLREIAKPQKNVITIEDPVEYKIEGINQMQVKPSIGLTFASGVRTSLRQDPDIILVGEVRDLETAQSCIRAALTGHLVLTTLHTNDAPSAAVRLKDFGIEPFLIGSSLLLVEAQRLVRKLCPQCKAPYEPSQAEKEKFKLKSSTIYKPKGCQECRMSGYKGRIGIYEMMPATPRIKDAIYRGATTDEIKKVAIEEGMLTLLYAGMQKVDAGITSLEEILATAYE